MTMMMFTAPLYLNNYDELTVANGYVNHNYQNWSANTALEITNNIYNNPLNLEIRHDLTLGDNMKTLLAYHEKVSYQCLCFYTYNINLICNIASCQYLTLHINILLPSLLSIFCKTFYIMQILFFYVMLTWKNIYNL